MWAEILDSGGMDRVDIGVWVLHVQYGDPILILGWDIEVKNRNI